MKSLVSRIRSSLRKKLLPIAAAGMMAVAPLIQGCGGGGGIPAGPPVESVEYRHSWWDNFDEENLSWAIWKVNSRGQADLNTINSVGFSVSLWPQDKDGNYIEKDPVPIQLTSTNPNPILGIAHLNDPNFTGWKSGSCANVNKYLGDTYTQIYDGTKKRQKSHVTAGMAKFPLGNGYTEPNGGYLAAFFDYSGETFKIKFPTSLTNLILEGEYNLTREVPYSSIFSFGRDCELNFEEESAAMGMTNMGITFRKTSGDVSANLSSLESARIDSEIKLLGKEKKMNFLEKLIQGLEYSDLVRSELRKVECYSEYHRNEMPDGTVNVNHFNPSGIIENRPFQIWHTRDVNEVWQAGSWRYAFSAYLPEELQDANMLDPKFAKFGSTAMIQVEDANRTPISSHEIGVFPVHQGEDAGGKWVGLHTNKILASYTLGASGLYLPQDPNAHRRDSKSIVKKGAWISDLIPIPDDAPFTSRELRRMGDCWGSSPDNDIPYDASLDKNMDGKINFLDFAARAPYWVGDN